MYRKLPWGVLLAVSIAVRAVAADAPAPTTSTDAAHALDHEQTRQLNTNERDMVRERDARYARESSAGNASANADAARRDYDARVRAYERQMAEYARNNARYEQQMAGWGRTVAACQWDGRPGCN